MNAWMRHPGLRRTFGLLALGLGFGPAAPAQQQFQGSCARVKIEILQELTIERIGFEATLEVTNNEGADPITDFFAELTFEDPTLSTAEETNDASGLFFVQAPRLTNISAVDGNGVIGPTKTAVVRWCSQRASRVMSATTTWRCRKTAAAHEPLRGPISTRRFASR